jgi:predicted RNA binding protein YcfA (HicA-like mRNA interferase family)
MTKLPVIAGQRCVKALQKAGFIIRRQSGSHIIMQRKDPFSQVSVPR